MPYVSTYTMLAMLGAAPFVGLAGLVLTGVQDLPIIGDTGTALATYGFGIVAFLTGTLWAAELHKPNRTPMNLFLVSNAVFLAVVGALLATPLRVALTIIAAGLVALWWIDRRLLSAAALSGEYFRARSIATALAALSLLAAVLGA